MPHYSSSDVLDNFSWVVPGRVAGCARPSTRYIRNSGTPEAYGEVARHIADLGFKTVVTLTEAPLCDELCRALFWAGQEHRAPAKPKGNAITRFFSSPCGSSPKTDAGGAPQASVLALHMPVEEFTAPSVEQMLAFHRLVLDEQRHPVLVHCRAGVGRTGTMLAVALNALMLNGDVPADLIPQGNFVRYLRKLRPYSLEVPEQVAAFEAYVKHTRPDEAVARQDGCHWFD